MAVNIAVRQGSPAWLEAKRSLITATDIPVLLGLSPYKCEADVADEKLSGFSSESTLRMRVGLALQDLIGEEYANKTGRRLRRYHGILRHDRIEWAGASLDFGVVGARKIVEAKRTTSRTRFADGLPQDVEAQVAWQLGVTGYPVADVAVLIGDADEVEIFEQPADPELFANLVTVAEDFRRRLAAGGPFERDLARLRRDYPRDNGAEMVADGEIAASVHALVAMRAERKRLEAGEEELEVAIKSRMGEIATVRGSDFRVTWKRSKDRTETDWRSIAEGLLTTLPETERDALVGIHSTVRPGFRPFRVVMDKED